MTVTVDTGGRRAEPTGWGGSVRYGPRSRGYVLIVFFAPLLALAKLGELGLHERRGEIRQHPIPIGSAFHGDPMTAMVKVWGIWLRQQVSKRLAPVHIGELHGLPPPTQSSNRTATDIAVEADCPRCRSASNLEKRGG